ncbi:WecB/TagA/CpsF family glycosyltransferase, partial [Phenylobacterium sp.]|uniref:WecB/TagA/CpsF family glycosyltransferase n=1 Tax=Phenylobacterium sp. TaxID=1871053 RepID=UPI00272F7FEC
AVLGGEIDLARPEEVMAALTAWVEADTPALIANHNLHSLYLLRRRPELATFFAAADLIEADSTPLLAFAALLGLPARPFHRCTYLDWRPHFWSLADRHGWRVFYLGAAPGVAQQAAERLSADYPGAAIGVHDGYFDAAPGSADNTAVREEIAAFAPDVLMVGMGMPRQELWILDNRAALPPCVILPVGAAFDYEAGAQKAAPRWMGRAGLEWLFRLVADPRRLWRRYGVEPWFLLGPALADLGVAHREGRLWRRTRSGRLPVTQPVGEAAPVQRGLNLGVDRGEPAAPAQIEKDLVAERPKTGLVDGEKA